MIKTQNGFSFFFRLFGTGKGNVAPRVQSPPERKRYPPGWKVDACVSVRECLCRCWCGWDESKFVGKHNDDINKNINSIDLCFGNKVGYDSGLFCLFFRLASRLLASLSLLSIAALLLLFVLLLLLWWLTLFVDWHSFGPSFAWSLPRWLSVSVFLALLIWVKKRLFTNGALTRGLHFVVKFFFIVKSRGSYSS